MASFSSLFHLLLVGGNLALVSSCGASSPHKQEEKPPSSLSCLSYDLQSAILGTLFN